MYLNKSMNSLRNRSTTIALSVALIFVIMVFSVGAQADNKLASKITTRTMNTVISTTQYVMNEFEVRGSRLKRSIEKKLQLD
jgi:hypothetical protein